MNLIEQWQALPATARIAVYVLLLVNGLLMLAAWWLDRQKGRREVPESSHPPHTTVRRGPVGQIASLHRRAEARRLERVK